MTEISHRRRPWWYTTPFSGIASITVLTFAAIGVGISIGEKGPSLLNLSILVATVAWIAATIVFIVLSLRRDGLA